MLSKWEERRLADIGYELRLDRALERVIGAPTRGELRRLGFRKRWAAFKRRWFTLWP